MIITRLAGGIGNQMFHYAIARNFQRSDSERIVLDTRQLRPLESDIEKILQRPYALGVFPKLRAAVIDDRLQELLEGSGFITRLRRRVLKAQTETVFQKLMEPVAIGARRTRNLSLIGNFQSEQHFSAIRNKLLDDFSFVRMDESNEAVKARIASEPHSLAIHLRRGDYLSTSNKGIFDSVNLHYYNNSLQRLGQLIPLASVAGFVFSDDIAWARENLSAPGLRLFYIDGNAAASSWKDMSLMSCCRHHIIANSSFSWWGGWLSRQEGENFLPRHWFRPSTYPYDIEHIAPKGWHVVDYNLH